MSYMAGMCNCGSSFNSYVMYCKSCGKRTSNRPDLLSVKDMEDLAKKKYEKSSVDSYIDFMTQALEAIVGFAMLYNLVLFFLPETSLFFDFVLFVFLVFLMLVVEEFAKKEAWTRNVLLFITVPVSLYLLFFDAGWWSLLLFITLPVCLPLLFHKPIIEAFEGYSYEFT